MPDAADSARHVVRRYHDGTKHHFHRYARSLGYLDWASQPHPFRTFAGADTFPLFPGPAARVDYVISPVAYDQLFDGSSSSTPFGAGSIGDLLRHALGLSAWKEFRESRWSLRVNPSSGNLHPTEAYIVCGTEAGLASMPGVYHYASDLHALQQRCAFDEAVWSAACDGRRDVLLLALTSIHWRESWKYGERAFRYCQHDLGHAVAAVSLAAAMLGWRARLLPAWSHRALATLIGIDRDEDFVEAEREDPGCLIVIAQGEVPRRLSEADSALVEAVRTGRWTGRASQLSEDHVQWTFIDEIAGATADPGRSIAAIRESVNWRIGDLNAPTRQLATSPTPIDARRLILQRRSAVAFDGRSSTDRETFLAMLARTMPGAGAPWQAVWWAPRIHLALFVHRVDDLAPGLYLLARRAGALDDLRTAITGDFDWEVADADLPLVRLASGDARALARRLSCDQEIASDGFFSLGMIAEFDGSLDEHGHSFYRHLFWETGIVGQVLYLEAEAARARATGIGCFFDDPVHDVLGIKDHRLQSLYHFTVGIPVEDRRLTTEPGYEWER